MEKRLLGQSGLEVFAIGLGITFLDTADMYGSGHDQPEVGNGAQPAAAHRRELVTAETAEPGTEPTRN